MNCVTQRAFHFFEMKPAFVARACNSFLEVINVVANNLSYVRTNEVILLTEQIKADGSFI